MIGESGQDNVVRRTPTVGDVLAVLDQIAPPELKEDYDNVGLLAGRPDRAVECALVALDLTEGVLDEAIERKARLIVTHHPILFHARKNLREDDPEGALLARLVRAGIALIAAHTNYDNADVGLNDALAEEVGLTAPETFPHGLRVGQLPAPLSPRCLADAIQKRLGGPVRAYIPRNAPPIERLAVLGGAGGFMYRQAAESGAQAFLTGEVRYHEALDGLHLGLTVFEAGHYETEHIAIKALTNHLQSRLDALQYTICIVQSADTPFIRYDV